MTAPLSLDHIRSLHAGITPGPWRAWKDNDGQRGSAVETAWTHDADGEDMELITDWCSHEDAAFIAAAPSMVAHLLGIVDAQQAKMDKVARLCDAAYKYGDYHVIQSDTIRAAITGDES